MDSRDESRPSRQRGWTDEEVDGIISRLLRFGLLASAALVAIGAVIFLARHGSETTAYKIFRGQPRDYREIKSIFTQTARFRGRGFIMAGLILLIATPVVRVIFSVVAFFRQRDHVFTAVTLIVLAILLYSVFWLGLR